MLQLSQKEIRPYLLDEVLQILDLHLDLLRCVLLGLLHRELNLLIHLGMLYNYNKYKNAERVNKKNEGHSCMLLLLITE